MNPDSNVLLAGVSLIAAFVLLVQVHAANLFQRSADFSDLVSQQGFRENALLMHYATDEMLGVSGAGQSPAESSPASHGEFAEAHRRHDLLVADYLADLKPTLSPVDPLSQQWSGR